MKENKVKIKVGDKVKVKGVAGKYNFGTVDRFQVHNKERVYVTFVGGGGAYYDTKEVE